MTTLDVNPSTLAMLASNPSALDPQTLSQTISTASLVLADACRLEAIAKSSLHDLHKAIADLRAIDRTTFAFPVALATLIDGLTLVKEAHAAGPILSSVTPEPQRPRPRPASPQARFTREPGRYVPGATRTTLPLLHFHRGPFDGLIDVDGVPTPWKHVPYGPAEASDVQFFERDMSEAGFTHGVLLAEDLMPGTEGTAAVTIVVIPQIEDQAVVALFKTPSPPDGPSVA